LPSFAQLVKQGGEQIFLFA